MLIRNELGII